MNAPLSAQTHYLAAFSLKAAGELKEPLSISVAKVIRDWVCEKETSIDGIRGDWFFTQGKKLSRKNPQTLVQVFSEPGTRTETDPEFWALHYRHSDLGRNSHRLWYSDLGLRTVSDGEILFGFRVSHSLRHDFIGVAPKPPNPSAPRLVESLFASEGWTVYSGKTRLQSKPIELALGKGEAFKNTIFSKNRSIPIVFVNGSFDAKEFPIDPTSLQKLVLGSAMIVWCDRNPDLSEELNFYLKGEYRCPPGMIRIFMPGADRSDPSDYLRHRFFSSQDIREYTAPVVIEAIVSGLVRRTLMADNGVITSIADITNNIRERRLEKYRSEGTPNPQWIGLLEEENRRICAENKAANSLLEEADATNRRLEFEVDNLKHNLQNLKASRTGSASITEDDRKALARVIALPNSDARPIDCLRVLAILYPDRVRLLRSASSSAEDADDFQQVGALWDLLQKLVTSYYSVLNDKGLGDSAARSVFGKNEYAAKESETVESSPDLLKHRVFQDSDKARTMLRHLKIGVKDSKAETIRVHFDWDAEERKLIIGHCGPHLPLS